MALEPTDPRQDSPADLKRRLAADRAGDPYVVFRDDELRQRIVPLAPSRPMVTVGRATGCEVALSWDEGVSRTHAVIERLGGSDDWALIDDGLSRNGSFVNGERLHGRRRLVDGDTLRFGDTLVAYRAPEQSLDETAPASEAADRIALSPAQRRVLIALCRPYRDGAEFATPASNQEIADELVLSVDAVKTHLRTLFERFGIGALPRQAKRAQLVQRAFETGTVTRRDLDEP
jgi:DNA-binding CsgD family transcriptional regulator